MYLKTWASFQIFRPCELHGYVCKTSISSEVNHQMESPLSSFPAQSVYNTLSTTYRYNIPQRDGSTVRQNGEAGCHPALGRDDGKLCGMSSRRGIEKVKKINCYDLRLILFLLPDCNWHDWPGMIF
jgi:hypothetical protein